MVTQKTAQPAEQGFLAFDYGTSGSRIAFMRGDSVALVTDLAGDEHIPSVLAISPQGGILAGLPARDRQTLFPQHTLISPKALLTADRKGLAARGPLFPHKLAKKETSMAEIEIGGRMRSAVEINAHFMAFLRRNAEVHLERAVDSGVFPVPSCFTPFDRQAFLLAGRLAGFRQVRLIDEPTAVALAWIARGGRGRIGVCTWGAGYLSMGIVDARDRLVRTLATGGAPVGGDRIDLALARDLMQRAAAEGEIKNPEHVARHLLVCAETAKRDLAGRGKAEVSLSLGPERESLRRSLTPKDLDELIEPLKEEASRVCRRVLTDAGLQRSEIDTLILAGGMMNVQPLADHLCELFGRDAMTEMDREASVVMGAHERARMLDHEKSDLVVLDANPLALGLEGQAEAKSAILERGVQLPASNRELFTTYLERQTEVAIQLYAQGVGDWAPLARLEISGIPPMNAGEPSLEVHFVVDEDGQLSVEARETKRSKPLNLEVRPLRGIPSSVHKAALEAIPEPPAPEDFEAGLRDELRQRGRFLLDSLRDLTKKQAGSMTRDEKQLIAKKSRELEEVLEGADLLEMRSCTQELEEVGRALIQRDIDAGMQAVLR